MALSLGQDESRRGSTRFLSFELSFTETILIEPHALAETRTALAEVEDRDFRVLDRIRLLEGNMIQLVQLEGRDL